MTDETVKLDIHRGMAAQKATDIRRIVAEVEANERSLRHLLGSNEVAQLPASKWGSLCLIAR
jgi:hypothetical protein